MKLDHPFIQLPLKFDAERLLNEVLAIEESAWQPHPQGYAGNEALTLITPYGINNSDETSGPMQPTEYLKSCPYLNDVLRCIGGVWGRTRLMRLSGQSEVTPHIDTNYYWRERMRVHVPIITQPSVRFYCADQDINMKAGECWVFDTWSMHNVVNDDSRARIHLVADTIGSEQFWAWFAKSKPASINDPKWQPLDFSNFLEAPPALRLESQNVPDVMTPWEMREHFNLIFNDAAPHIGLQELSQLTYELCISWQALWFEFGSDKLAYPKYANLRNEYLRKINVFDDLQLNSGYRLISAISQGIMLHCLKDDLKNKFKEHRETGQNAIEKNQSKNSSEKNKTLDVNIEQALIIISSPRSGSTMLFEALEKCPELSSIGGESHNLFESIDILHPGSRNYDSNVLGAKHCSQVISRELHSRFIQDARKSEITQSGFNEPIRLLEKTPKNALRIPFMKQLFPEAQFVYLYRDPKNVISSMLDAWQSGRFVTYPDLPNWQGQPWSLLLTPGWREIIGKPLHHIVAHQWATTTRIMLDDLEALDQSQIIKVSYENLLLNTNNELNRVCTFAGVSQFANMQELALSKHTLTIPDPNKWKRNELLIEEIWPIIESQALRASAFMKAT